MELTVKILVKDEKYRPEYKTALAAGADLKARLPEGPVTLAPGERKLIFTGVFIALPEGYEAQVRPRSGLAAKNGISVVNAPGTIDADYRGEIGVVLINHGYESFKINDCDRIAQLVINEIPNVKFEVVDELDDTARGEGGFCSTGIQ